MNPLTFTHGAGLVAFAPFRGLAGGLAGPATPAPQES